MQAGLLIGRTTVGTLGRCKAQWQTALGEVVAAGLDCVIKLATIVDARSVPKSSKFRVLAFRLQSRDSA